MSWDNPYLLIQCDAFQTEKRHLVLIERIFEHQNTLTIYLKDSGPRLPTSKIVFEKIPIWAPALREAFHKFKGTFLPSIFSKPLTWFSQPKNIALSIGVLFAVLIAFYQGFTHLYLVVPDEFDAYLGKKVKAELMKTEAACSNLDMQEYLNAMAKELRTDESQSYRVSVVKTKVENAYALPGGDIVFTSGLLEKAESEEEIMGIMAHEMTHVEQRHGIQQLMRYIGLGVIGAFAFTEGLEALADPELVATLLSVVLVLKYSREFEREADQGAMDKLFVKNINPLGMKDFFDRSIQTDTEDESELFKYLSSHPMSKNRIEFFQSYFQENHAYEKFNQSLFWQKEGYELCP